MFQDEDGNISSYFQDFETSEAIRMTPEESAVNSYYELPPAPPSSALNEKLKVAGVLDLLTPFETN